MTAPAPRSRWVHRSCKRVVIVVAVTGNLVSYHYIRTAGTEGLMRSRATPVQTMALDEWSRLFTSRAA